jgi:hypothetical protein
MSNQKYSWASLTGKEQKDRVETLIVFWESELHSTDFLNSTTQSLIRETIEMLKALYKGLPS